jgi:hypothetical protein
MRVVSAVSATTTELSCLAVPGDGLLLVATNWFYSDFVDIACVEADADERC